ncbi:hypothetical protein BG011_004684 [Mortierella polycephala]|uniref:Uncharacterized protein n=1 Tax=Mortierella polycephala TaxID=41804 RepID=A0A9P6QDJ2_9FUNG|nr:hypothetical protein BG011_004684 [Mortierella polycephala]
MASIAAAAFRGNTLYILYSTPTNNLGTLYAVSTSPPTSAGSGTNGGPNTMWIQPQNLPLGPTGRAPSSISMVPILVLDPQAQPYRNDILIALNMPGANPSLLRLKPVAPNMGDGKIMEPGSADWTVAEDSPDEGMVPLDATQVSMATGSTSGPEGTAVYEVFVSKSPGYLVQKMDVTKLGSGAKSSPVWALPSDQLLDNTSYLKMVRLTDKDQFNAVITGKCLASSGQNKALCMMFLTDTGNKSYGTTSNAGYDPKSCIVEYDGSLVMATSSRTMTLELKNFDSDWKAHPGNAILPSDILACAVAGSKLYAVTQGGAATPEMPVIQIMDLAKPNWEWQTADLNPVRTDIEVIIPTPSPSPTPGTNPGQRPDNSAGGGDSSTGTNPDTVSSSQGTGLSTAVIVVIAVAALLILLLIAFILFWRRRKNKNKSASPYHIDQKKILPTTAPAYSPSLKKHSGKLAHEYDGGSPRSNYSRDYNRDYDHDDRDDYDSYSRHGGDSPATRYTYSPQTSYSPFPSSRPTEQVNVLTMPVATPPETPLQNHRRTDSNNKEELARENASQYTASTSSVANPQVNMGGFLHPGGSPNMAPRSKKRLQETLSPGLANAQLILQQTQAARNAAARNNANKS